MSKKLFYHYQTALITMPSSINIEDTDEWLKEYDRMQNALLADIDGDFRAGNLTAEDHDKLIKIINALRR